MQLIKDHIMKNPRSSSPSPSPTRHAHFAETDPTLIRAGVALAIDPDYVNPTSNNEHYAALSTEERAPRRL
ncbi:hypothetical protein C0992_013382 [Termitomyces sp. T32_za158]|nr:hypothetical protein C0992_013382 [Termitomyces sp. T32_za158]